ncbi:MAG: hypothetical protein WA821_20250 [Anaerolineales bacterium]
MKIHLVLKYLLGTFAACLVLTLVLVLVESLAHPFEKLLDDVIYDNRNHYLSCDQLPTPGKVRSVLAAHKNIVVQIKQVDRGAIMVYVGNGNDSCSGKADILITYPSRADRIKIQQIINSDTFFGIPYRLLDV